MKFGVIGAGVIGRLRAATIARRRDTTLVAVADSDQAAAARAVAGTGARTWPDYRRIVDDPAVDAIVISTPVQLHEQMALAALEAGKHVLCEKPLSNDVPSCRRMLEAARTRGRTLAVGFNHRYYPSVKFLKQVVDDGSIGRLDHVRVFGGHDGLENFRADWMYVGALSGGGAMMDVGIHMTDLARFVAGEMHEVYGVASNGIWKVPGSEDNAMAIFKSRTGIAAIYQATWTEWKGYRIFLEAYGDRGMVRAHYAPMFNLVIARNEGGGRKRQVKLYPSIIVREKLRGWESTTLATFEQELGDFLKMIAGATVPLADGWSGVRAVEIAHAVYRSSSTGEVVTLSEPPTIA
jgi:predicted dehydrogenase